jgi:hypothetical protein
VTTFKKGWYAAVVKFYRNAICLLAACFCLDCGKVVETPLELPEKIPTTYRIISGVSMGGIGTAALGFSAPERFDAVGVQGGPLDAAFFFRMLDKFALGGFCPRTELEKILAADPSGLNDATQIEKCRTRLPLLQWEHQQDFNHWRYTTNSANFNRDSYLGMISDIALGFGNPFTENPASPYAPPGVDPERLRHPPGDFCTHPVRVKSLFNAEYNPEGKYDAITFCDGQPSLFFCRSSSLPVDFCSDARNRVTPLPQAEERSFADEFCRAQGGAVEASVASSPLYMLDHAGAVDPCRESSTPVTVALAYDYNGNGRRDYGEPTVNNPWERFDDVGVDGCADAFEDGKGGCSSVANPASRVDPNHDNYEVDLNPRGTEADWLWEEGEPFADDGLDGVPSTFDLGEGNGKYDLSSGRQTMLRYDGRSNFRKLTEKQQRRLNVLCDGGIRDVFNLGLMSKQLFGAIKAARKSPVGEYRAFNEIPGMVNPRTGNFSPWNGRWKNLPHDLLMLYGKDAPTDDDRKQGDGDHVGTNEQAVERYFVMFNWAGATWPKLSRPATPWSTTSATERQRIEWFDSKALNAKREYAIALPPGYDLPENADQRYPVLFMLHGYGMEPKGLLGTSLVTDGYAMDPEVAFRPMIQVFPSGRCCFVKLDTHEKDCRETDETGARIGTRVGWERECNSGSFYVNRRGYTPQDTTAYGDAFFELMDHIDHTYRTLSATEVEAR